MVQNRRQFMDVKKIFFERLEFSGDQQQLVEITI